MVVDYIAKFDDLMIRCNMDEEPVATLARFRAGLRPEFQRELVLHEVLMLEKAYHYTINMELYSAHAQKVNTTWLATGEVMRLVQSSPVSSSPTPLPLVGLPATPSPPPLRLLLPATHR